MHNASSSVILRMVGVGSSREANRVQATAAKATAAPPSGHAVAIQKNAHIPIATAAASADNNAIPGSVCIGLGPICSAAARMSALGVCAGSARYAVKPRQACQASMSSINRTVRLIVTNSAQDDCGPTAGVAVAQASLS